MSDGELWASLSRLVGEAGRTARAAAERAADLAAEQLSPGKDQWRWPLGKLIDGPIIPEPYTLTGRKLSWQDGYLASCALSVSRAVQHHGVQPATAGLVAAQAALHCRPGGYRLLQVGLNAHRVLHNGEWRRLGTSPLLHADLPHLVSNCTALVVDGLPLERRLGSARFLGLVLSTAALTQALYLLCSKVAADRLPRSGLANDYYSAYSVGFSGVAMALKVVAGYMREAELARARLAVPEEFQLTAGRLGAWPSLIMSHWLVPTASLPGHLCGVAAGLAHVYGARAAAWLWRCLRRGARPGWRRAPPAPVPALLDLGSSDHPGLGWLDLGSQVLLGCGTVLMAHLAAAQRKG